MNIKRMKTFAAVAMVVTCLVGPLSGCVPFSSRCACRIDPMLRTQRSLPTQPADATEQDVLTAVEEFLERTKEYQSVSTDSQSSSLTSPPATRAAVENNDQPHGTPQESKYSPSPRDQAFANMQVMLAGSVSAAPAPALPVVKSVSIHVTPSLDIPTVEPAKTKTTNEALDMRSTETPMLVDRFISQLEARAAEANDFDSEWQLRFTQLALHRDDEAAGVSPGLSQEAKRMLTSLIRMAASVWRTVQNPLLTGEETLNYINELREVLADRADPIIATIALCRNVVTFGVYKEMNVDAFVAGRTVQTIVYSEIRNFRSESTEDGQYRTRLGTRLEVLTAEGKSVWQHEEPEITDICRRRRTDFFIAQRITLPPTLPAGDYVLKLFVEDKLSERAIEASHPFTLQSAISVAHGF